MNSVDFWRKEAESLIERQRQERVDLSVDIAAALVMADPTFAGPDYERAIDRVLLDGSYKRHLLEEFQED